MNLPEGWVWKWIYPFGDNPGSWSAWNEAEGRGVHLETEGGKLLGLHIGTGCNKSWAPFSVIRAVLDRNGVEVKIEWKLSM
jgi:hypothetical protein